MRALKILAAAAMATTLYTPHALACPASTEYHTYLRSTNGWNYVSTEAGWNGSTGVHAQYVLRARQVIPGPREGYELEHLPGMPAGTVAIWSDAAAAFVSAEFSWPGAARGTLHARPGQTSVGPWETFYQVKVGGSGGYPIFTLRVKDSSGDGYYVSADQGSGYPGDLQGLLQADKTTANASEEFSEGPGPLNLVTGNDYPWKNLPFNGGTDAIDHPIGGFQYARECDSFVAWKIYENSGGRQYDQTSGPGGTPTDYRVYSVDINTPPRGLGPNAANWAENAHSYNSSYWVDQTPTPGSVAQWDAHTGGMGGFGHVAYVDRVYADGSVDLENYNINLDGDYTAVHVQADSSFTVGGSTFGWPSHFVHINQLR